MVYSPYEVRLHLFQARDLPPMDDNGLLDPYVVAVLGGQRLQLLRQRAVTAAGRASLAPCAARIRQPIPMPLSPIPISNDSLTSRDISCKKCV